MAPNNSASRLRWPSKAGEAASDEIAVSGEISSYQSRFDIRREKLSIGDCAGASAQKMLKKKISAAQSWSISRLPPEIAERGQPSARGIGK